MYQETHQTPFGWLTVHSNGQGVTHVDGALNGIDDDRQADDVSRETWKQINDYCSGRQKTFSVPLEPEASPALKTWLQVMRGINYGKTVTYQEFAKMAGTPKASRAAGSACARNPIPLIIPCHRVTRFDGSLGNYGAIRTLSPQDHRNLAIKAALIEHERRYFN